MYGKLFASMFRGSLYGKWHAIVTFQQMIILADQDGTVDYTPEALSATTSIPLDIIQQGISLLESPDPTSRTPDAEGRRIVRLDPDRPWGWHIVNYAHYRAIRTAEERRAYHRDYWRKNRANEKDEKEKKKAHGIVEELHHNLSSQPLLNNAQGSQPIAEAEVNAEAEALKTDGLNPKAWERFIQYRKDIGKPYKKASIMAAQKKLAGFGVDQMAVVEQTIANGWTGLFELKKQTKSGKKTYEDYSNNLKSNIGVKNEFIHGDAERVD